MDDADEPLDTASALKLYSQQRARTVGLLRRPGQISTAVWGLAWLIAYGTLWLGSDAEGYPLPWAFVGFGLSLAIAIAVASIADAKSARTTSGRTARLSKWFWLGVSLSWMVGMVGLSLVVVRYPMPPAAVATLYNLLALLLLGSQSTAAGAIFADRASYLQGIVAFVLALVVVIVGVPAGYLLMALVGGGGMLAIAIIEVVLLRREGH